MNRTTKATSPGPGQACAALLLALLFSPPSAASAQPGGALPGRCRSSRPDNWWNTDISAAPVDPQQRELHRFIGADARHASRLRRRRGRPLAPRSTACSTSSCPGTQPLVPVTFVEYGDESDAGAPGRPAGYPIPDEAKTQQKWIEGGIAGNAERRRRPAHADRRPRQPHPLRALPRALERRAQPLGGGLRRDLPARLEPRRPDGWTSADAAGLAILRAWSATTRRSAPRPIRHAFRVTVRRQQRLRLPRLARRRQQRAAPCRWARACG